MNKGGSVTLPEPLTPRERNILAHLANRKSGQEIAELETLAYGSVKWYIHQIYAKLMVNRRSEAIIRAKELGLLPLEPVRFDTVFVVDNNLPRQLTSFIGREEEIAQLQALIQEHPLVTLTGSGGVGKTRLSLEVAKGLVDQFADGVWLVELAPVIEATQVVQVVAATLGLKSLSRQPVHEILLDYLRDKQVLLVLDNCEHLIGTCASLVDELLRISPRLKILASSREALGVAGEIPFRVPSMSLPDAQHLPEITEISQFEAVRLFCERARAIWTDFQITAENAAVVAQICQRLDGIPLAIELAAARLLILAPEQLLQQLENAFRVLAGGARSALPRQQTLRATIDWSYRLLTENEKAVLRRLAVFTGSFDLPAVEAIACVEAEGCPDGVELLASLANQSMLSVEPQPDHDMRYRLLETVRQYAREKLDDSGESSRLRDLHADYYLDLAKQVGQNIFSKNAPSLLRWLKYDFPNVRAAFVWALEGSDVEKANETLVSLWYYWLICGNADEARSLLENAQSKVNPVHPSVARAALLRSLGLLSEAQGRFGEALEDFTLSREMSRELGDRSGYAWASLWMGTITFREYHYYEESAAIHKELGDEDSWAFTIWLWGCNSKDYGDLDQSERLLEESKRFYQKAGSWFLGIVYSNQARLYSVKGQFQKARSLFEQALPMIKEVDSQWEWMWWHRFKGEMDLSQAVDIAGLRDAEVELVECMETAKKFGNQQFFLFSIPILLAKKAFQLGEVSMALRRYRETLRRYRELISSITLDEDGDFSNLGQCFIGLAEIALGQDNALCCTWLLGALDEMGIIDKDVWEGISRKDFERISEGARSRLAEPDFQTAWAEGRRMSLGQAIQLALDEQCVHG